MTVQPTPWQPVVRPPVTGEPVNQAVAGRGHRDNEQRTRHLKEVLDVSLAGRALILRDQVMATTTKVYQAVYLDIDNVWKPAKAEFESGSISYPAYLSRRAYAAGVVSGKDQPGLGSVCLYGEIQADAGLLDVLDSDYSPNLVYLSMMAEGNLTTARQPVSVRIGLVRGPDASGNYRFLVQPQSKSEIADHVHYKFDLYDIPAGRANCVPPYDDFMPAELEHAGPYPGTVHQITEPDPDLPGWLPVDSPVFTGLTKPAGAKFGYNIEQHPELKEVWPPLPAQYAYISLNGRGLGSSQCIIDEFGIWWMDDRYGKAPWVINLSPCLSSSSLTSHSSSAPASEYPLETRDIELWFTRLIFGPGANLVSSLRPADASMAVMDLNGVASRYGDLQVKVAQPVEVEDARPRALKAWTPSTGEIGVGPVVGGIRPGSPELVLSGATPDASGFYRGDLVLSFVDPSAQRDLGVQLVALNNVEEETVSDVLVLTFPASRTAQIRGKVPVAAVTLQAGSAMAMRFRFWFLARTAVTLSALTMSLSYRRVPRPTGCVPSVLPAVDTAVDFANMCDTEIPAGSYVEVVSEAIEVEPADIVYFTLLKEDGPALSLIQVVPATETV